MAAFSSSLELNWNRRQQLGLLRARSLLRAEREKLRLVISALAYQRDMRGWRWREGFPGGLGRVSKSLRENMTFTKGRQKIILIPLNKVISE